MALFNAEEEPKKEISKIARSDIPLEKKIPWHAPEMPNTHAEPVLPLQPLLKLSSVTGKEQHVLPELMDSTAEWDASGRDRAPGGMSKFLSIDTEMGSTYPSPVPILGKKHILFF